MSVFHALLLVWACPYRPRARLPVLKWLRVYHQAVWIRQSQTGNVSREGGGGAHLCPGGLLGTLRRRHRQQCSCAFVVETLPE